MADGGSTQVFRYLFNSMRYDNGSASNAISAQIFKTLAVIKTMTVVGQACFSNVLSSHPVSQAFFF
jgi:hypothetical protein